MAKYRKRPVELKPCPFCGGPAVINENGFCVPHTYFVNCLWCGAQTDCDDSKKVATEAWNRRV